MTFQASETVKREAYRKNVLARAKARLNRIERLKAKVIEDPEGIWAELLDESVALEALYQRGLN